MKNLKDLMESHAISAEQLGPIISVSARQIYRWIADEAEIKSSNLIALANYFKCSADELLDRNVFAEPTPATNGIKITPLARRLLDAFYEIEEVDQHKLVAMAEALSTMS
ncbi:MAG: helix-turn-helix domain-containing protein [Corallococcus sp.]|nr:helix-turn-helix domain-containing protein [Corallococcus sp.]MCM1359090.1 helix-turn-helix domain-containing protein [Corallococcus sp.]MCM1395079.1 helix-turn-helix domain-containing protein [Corallococcus sp.]